MAKKKEPRWSVIQHGPQAATLKLKPMRSGDKQRLLLIADEHWDNVNCQRELLASHLQEALDTDSPVIRVGDTYCAMQGRWDPRADRSQLRPEHSGNDYLDQLVATSVRWYREYAPVIALSMTGNHEASIYLRNQTNLLQRWHDLTRSKCREYIGIVGGYSGFLGISIPTTGSRSIHRTMYLHHGYGGGGEVTRGFIDHSRTRGQAIADVYVSGHIHRRNVDENMILTYHPGAHSVEKRQQLFVRCGTYKSEENCTWHVSKGRAARPLGGYWLEVVYRSLNQGESLTLIPIPA